MADALTWLRAEWDRILGVTLVMVGGVALLLGYWGVAHARYTPDGLAYIVSGGIGGLFLLGLGATLLLCADLHDEWRKFDRIEAALVRLAGSDSAGDGDIRPAVSASGFVRFPADGTTGASRVVGGALLLAVGVLLGGWVLAARASTAGNALGGAVVAGAALLLCAGGTATYTSVLRRAVRRRVGALLGPVVVAEAASGLGQSPSTAWITGRAPVAPASEPPAPRSDRP